MIAACKVAGFDLVIVETSGIGQGDAAIVPLVDVSLYVMTPEFGAASQLEKIDMLDFADFVAINKFDRKGAQDALRDVRKQYQRNRELFKTPPDEMPVFGTIAARFNDDGVTALYQALLAEARRARACSSRRARCRRSRREQSTGAARRSCRRRASRYLAEIAETRARLPRAGRTTQARIARERQQLRDARSAMLDRRVQARTARELDALAAERDAAARSARAGSSSTCGRRRKAAYAGDEYVVKIRDKEIRTALTTTSLSGTQVRKVALPQIRGRRRDPALAAAGERAGQLSRSPPACSRSSARTRTRRGCSPARATPFRTNRRFHLLADGMPAKRLSTAFDSVTLYGNDPDRAARHLRQGRQLRRVDRDARRHEGALLGLRPLRARTTRCR